MVEGCGKVYSIVLMNSIIPEFYDGDISAVLWSMVRNTLNTQFINYSRM